MLRWLGRLCWGALAVWGSALIYFSIAPPLWLALIPSAVFVAATVAGFSVLRSARASLGAFFVLLGAALLILNLKSPANDRDWSPEVARTPRAVIQGDVVKLTDVRNFDYRTKTDFTERWESREVHLSHLTGADFFVSYWSPEPGMMAHTFVSFLFDDAPPVCISIEARKERGEPYGPVASLFKEFELVYVIGEERDVVGVRTHHRQEQVYLYHLRMRPEGIRRLFLDYLERANALAERPEFYHLLSNNCTSNISRHATQPGRATPFYWRALLNGYSDELIYDLGGMDKTLPFPELKAASCINPLAKEGVLDEGFSARIRPGFHGMPVKE